MVDAEGISDDEGRGRSISDMGGMRVRLVKESWRMLTDSMFGNSECGSEGFLTFRPKALVSRIAVVCHGCYFIVDHAVPKAVGTKVGSGIERSQCIP